MDYDNLHFRILYPHAYVNLSFEDKYSYSKPMGVVEKKRVVYVVIQLSLFCIDQLKCHFVFLLLTFGRSHILATSLGPLMSSTLSLICYLGTTITQYCDLQLGSVCW